MGQGFSSHRGAETLGRVALKIFQIVEIVKVELSGLSPRNARRPKARAETKDANTPQLSERKSSAAFDSGHFGIIGAIRRLAVRRSNLN